MGEHSGWYSDLSFLHFETGSHVSHVGLDFSDLTNVQGFQVCNTTPSYEILGIEARGLCMFGK